MARRFRRARVEKDTPITLWKRAWNRDTLRPQLLAASDRLILLRGSVLSSDNAGITR
jgi:hypothetical protein